MARIKIGNIKGPQGIQGKQGIPGPTGATGPQGPLPPLTNNGLATVPGVAALDAVMGKTLTDKDADIQQQVTQLNSDFPYKLAARTFNAQQNPIDINPKETKPVKVDLSADGNACYGFICCLSGGITAYQLYNGAVTQYTIGIMNLSDSPISISGYIFYLMNK